MVIRCAKKGLRGAPGKSKRSGGRLRESLTRIGKRPGHHGCWWVNSIWVAAPPAKDAPGGQVGIPEKRTCRTTQLPCSAGQDSGSNGRRHRCISRSSAGLRGYRDPGVTAVGLTLIARSAIETGDSRADDLPRSFGTRAIEMRLLSQDNGIKYYLSFRGQGHAGSRSVDAGAPGPHAWGSPGIPVTGGMAGFSGLELLSICSW